jgi:hypothetical protein
LEKSVGGTFLKGIIGIVILWLQKNTE